MKKSASKVAPKGKAPVVFNFPVNRSIVYITKFRIIPAHLQEIFPVLVFWRESYNITPPLF